MGRHRFQPVSKKNESKKLSQNAKSHLELLNNHYGIKKLLPLNFDDIELKIDMFFEIKLENFNLLLEVLEHFSIPYKLLNMYKYPTNYDHFTFSEDISLPQLQLITAIFRSFDYGQHVFIDHKLKKEVCFGTDNNSYFIYKPDSSDLVLGSIFKEHKDMLSFLEDYEEDYFKKEKPKRKKLKRDFHEQSEEYGSSYAQYGGYNGFSDDVINDAFDGDPMNTWNVD